MNEPSLICLIPVHNEGSHLRGTLKELIARSPLKIRHVVLCENGSRDQTMAELQKLQREDPEFYTVVAIPNADFGLALRQGMAKINEKFPDGEQWIHFNGADVPFGISDIRAFQLALQGNPTLDLALGSKFHPESQVIRHWSRTMASSIFFLLRFLFTGMRFSDTQGTLFFKLSNTRLMAPALRTQGFITTTEMIYWHAIHRKTILEVPVIYKGDTRPSSVRIFRNGIQFIVGLIQILTNRLSGKYDVPAGPNSD